MYFHEITNFSAGTRTNFHKSSNNLIFHKSLLMQKFVYYFCLIPNIPKFLRNNSWVLHINTLSNLNILFKMVDISDCIYVRRQGRLFHRQICLAKTLAGHPGESWHDSIYFVQNIRFTVNA